MENVDESVPYPPHYHSYYSETKALAEQKVLAANGDDLRTLALRPHLIWGPRDNHIVPRLISRARAGRLMQIGPGDNRVDSTYIDNAAEAHVLAAEALKVNCRDLVWVLVHELDARVFRLLGDLVDNPWIPHGLHTPYFPDEETVDTVIGDACS